MPFAVRRGVTLEDVRGRERVEVRGDGAHELFVARAEAERGKLGRDGGDEHS